LLDAEADGQARTCLNSSWMDSDSLRLNSPVKSQVARARTRLEQLQIAFAEENDFVDKLRINTSRRARRTLWPFYLRVLDARNEGMTFEQIGLTLGRYEDRDQAKKDAHKWHEAGSRIATATIWD
jgi:hypothetical protein